MNYLNKIKTNHLIILLIFIFGSIISLLRGSNFSDGDSYSVILAFTNLIDFSVYTPSRGAYGHPIPELFIGLIAYFFGTPYSNLFCFICFVAANIIFYITFINKKEYLFLFLLIIFTNFKLFIDNTNSIDYPIALLFFSLGIFFLNKKNIFYSSIFFGFCIASRANFLAFIYPIILIYFLDEIKKFKFKNFFFLSIFTTCIGLVFYFLVFKTNDYSFNFIDLPFVSKNNNMEGWYGGPPLNLESLLPRFIYKIYKLIGIFSCFLLLFNIKKILFSILNTNKLNLILISTIFINLSIYFLMPTKQLLINPFIIFLYIVAFKCLNKKTIIILILLNFLQWFVSYEILNIKYKYQNICKPVEAMSAKIELTLKKGDFIDYLSSDKDYTSCYSDAMGKYSYEFERGLPLRLSR